MNLFYKLNDPTLISFINLFYKLNDPTFTLNVNYKNVNRPQSQKHLDLLLDSKLIKYRYTFKIKITHVLAKKSENYYG